MSDAVTHARRCFLISEWGIDLASEHERFLAEEVYKGPVICYNYPKAIKVWAC